MNKKLQNYFQIYSEHREITVQEHEEIFDTVFRKIKKTESPSIWTRFRSPLVIGIAVAGAFVLLLLPVVWLHEKNRRSQSEAAVGSDEYSVKGGLTKPFVVIECTGSGERGGCHRNSVMIFKIHPPRDQNYFSAFARHIETNTAVWYYPATKDGRSLFIEQADAGQLLTDGIVIGDGHLLGKYEVISIFSNRALGWDDIRELFEDKGRLAKSNYTVVKNKIRIE